MGYDTDFSGRFELNTRLNGTQTGLMNMFASTRRMKRDPKLILTLPKGQRNEECLNLIELLNLRLGPEGDLYCGTGWAGQDSDPSIIDYNINPSSQPSLWCDWIPTKDRRGIEWNGSEKFYAYDR